MNKRNIAKIIISISIILILLSIIIIVLNSNNKTTEDTNIDSYNGLYSNDDSEIWLYEDNDVVYYITSKDSKKVDSLGKLTKNDNKLTGKIEIIKKHDTIKISDREQEYHFDRDITIDEFFEFGYGKNKYFNSDYNGYYSAAKEYLYIYQSDEKEVKVIININNKKDFLTFNIDSMNSLISYGEDGQYSIIYSDGKSHDIMFTKKNTTFNDKGIKTNEEEVYTLLLKKKNTVTKIDIVKNI